MRSYLLLNCFNHCSLKARYIGTTSLLLASCPRIEANMIDIAPATKRKTRPVIESLGLLGKTKNALITHKKNKAVKPKLAIAYGFASLFSELSIGAKNPFVSFKYLGSDCQLLLTSAGFCLMGTGKWFPLLYFALCYVSISFFDILYEF